MVNLGGLDLFGLFVENIFGGVLISILGFCVLFTVLGMFTRMSPILLIMSIGLFCMVMAIGFLGGAAVFLFGLIAIIYFFQGLGRFIATGG
jgi:uncharacterized membrane protein